MIYETPCQQDFSRLLLCMANRHYASPFLGQASIFCCPNFKVEIHWFESKIYWIFTRYRPNLKVILVTLWWRQFEDVGGRIIIWVIVSMLKIGHQRPNLVNIDVRFPNPSQLLTTYYALSLLKKSILYAWNES